MTEDANVLVVDDNADVVWTHRNYLEPDYVVHTAQNGEEALAVLEDEDIDVVLLDRRMPGMSGREVLEEIQTRGFDCRVAIVTAVDPDFDIISMGFDDYVTKPPSETELAETVAHLLSLSTHADRIREYHSLISKQVTLEAQKFDQELAESDEYTQLKQEIESAKSELNELDLEDDANFLATIRSIDGGEETNAE